MAPKSPWKRKVEDNDQAVVAAATTLPGINYKEVQDEEIEVLQAIFMQDYHEVETKGAWSKTTDRCFKLTLKSFSDVDTYVVISVTLTATYPKTAPLLQLDHFVSLHERTQKRIQTIIRLKPKEMAGEVMVHAIASDIQEALEDAVSARERGALPSLEEERATNEEIVTALAKQAKDEQARRQAEARAEEDRLLKQMVDQEIGRREQRRPVKANLPRTTSTEKGDTYEIVRFDQPVVLRNDLAYTSVSLVSRLFRDSRNELFLAQPSLQASHYSAQPTVLRRVAVNMKCASREDVVSLEGELEVLKSLRQPNIASLLAFRLDRSDDVVQLALLLDHGNRGSLFELFEDGALPSLPKAKQWTVDLLEAVDYLHRNAVVHKDIHAKNILICRAIGEQPVPKLTDSSYQQHLHELQGSEPGWRKLPGGWQSPEYNSISSKSRKTDIWELGVVFLQLLFGNAIFEQASPSALSNRLDLSEELNDLVMKWLQKDSRRRPSAFDLIPSEFLRTDAMPLPPFQDSQQRRSTSTLISGSHTRMSTQSRRPRHESQNGLETAATTSRYVSDFAELGRLGKGGFGEVVKARNKLDGGIYAIKKVRQESTSQLEHVLSEVMLLNRLNHPYVVRYYSTWVEDDVSGMTYLDEEAISTTDGAKSSASDDCPRINFGIPSTGGLDFVSLSGYPQIEFGDDDDEDTMPDSDDASEHSVEAKGHEVTRSAENEELRLAKTVSDSRRATKSTLYIQMEFCERQTLRDLIRRDLCGKPDESWRLLRQITEGLSHIHGHGIIHRDLKPDNVFIDMAGNPRIGDFGLATTSLYQNGDKETTSSNTGGDMTRSVGTALYVAPELRSSADGTYTNKVDIYSLGIVFFEMTCTFKTAMERDHVIRQLREKDHSLPATFEAADKAGQGSVILSLIAHRPGDRPTAAELLHSDRLPFKIKDETIRQALSSLSDVSSPYHYTMMSALFSQGLDQRVKEKAWELNGDSSAVNQDNARCRVAAKNALEHVFRRHGAEEFDRPAIFPRSAYYTSSNVVQLLDASGNLLQLPFDLTLPYARLLANSNAVSQKTFAFGNVYRETFKGGPPRPSREVDFDVVSSGSFDIDGALEEAEVLKVVDEIIEDIPALSTSQMSIHISHGTLIDCVLDLCRIDIPKRTAVKEVVSKLNLQKWSWSSIRDELRLPGLAISATSLDDLQQFDFRDTPTRAFSRLHDLFAGTNQESRLEKALAALAAVVQYANAMRVRRKIFISPLSCFNEKFYTRSFVFQVVHDRKQRDVFAAGGRYDSLVASHRCRDLSFGTRAVGVSIGFDRLVTLVARYAKRPEKGTHAKRGQHGAPVASSGWISSRCDVAVVASDLAVKDAGLKTLVDLWANDISAELGTESSDADFIITIKHEASTTVRVRKTGSDSTGQDLPSTGLVAYLRQEMRDRENTKVRQPMLSRQMSHGDGIKGNVQVLTAQHRSKKSNKYQIVEAAQKSWSEKIEEWKNAPILAIETRDEVLHSIQETRLGDAESWRKAIHSVQLNERQYLQQVQDILSSMRKRWMEEDDGVREASVFNFRTGTCIYYDLGI